MRLTPKTWALAVSGALLAATGALYATRPSASPADGDNSALFVGRDHNSNHAADPLTADDIAYRVPRDKIQAIDRPTFIRGDQAGFVPDSTPVIGVTSGPVAKAYPVPVLSRAEIVNDEIEGTAIAVTW